MHHGQPSPHLHAGAVSLSELQLAGDVRLHQIPANWMLAADYNPSHWNTSRMGYLRSTLGRYMNARYRNRLTDDQGSFAGGFFHLYF